MTRGEAMEQIEKWREKGWLVRLTMMPPGSPFIAQGSASEYAPSPDAEIEGTEGWVSCDLSWVKYGEENPTRHEYPFPKGMGDDIAQAVERAADDLENLT